VSRAQTVIIIPAKNSKEHERLREPTMISMLEQRYSFVVSQFNCQVASNSFLPEGKHRVNLCCTSGWKPTAEGGSQRNQPNFDPEAASVFGPESWEHSTQNSDGTQRDCDPTGQPNSSSSKALAKDQRLDTATRSPQRNTNPDFLRASRGNIRCHSINAGRRHCKGKATGQSQEEHYEPPIRKGVINESLHGRA
jgi:hypothetical protein